MSALFLLQLSKLKKIKCLYFLDQTSFEGDISSLVILWFHEDVENSFTSYKMLKISYLPQMTSHLKNKVNLLSSTCKVELGKVYPFSWSEVILVSYGKFIVSWRYQKTPQRLQNDKKLISPSNDVELKNKGTLFSSTFKVEDKKVHLFFYLDVNLVRYGDFVILPILSFLGHYLYFQRGGENTNLIRKFRFFLIESWIGYSNIYQFNRPVQQHFAKMEHPTEACLEISRERLAGKVRQPRKTCLF